MKVLSFCTELHFTKALDCEVVQAYEQDIPNMNIGSEDFQAILINHTEILKLLKPRLTDTSRITIPVIMLIRDQPSYQMIRICIDSGVSDFCMFPYYDLKSIIIFQYMKIDEMRDAVEQKLNQLRNTLMYTIPHEFNTPLTAILGLAGLLAKGDISDHETLKDFSVNILKSAYRLQKIIDNFTYYSHLQLKLSSNSEVSFARSFCLQNPDQVIKLVIHDLQHLYNKEIRYAVSGGIVQCNETNFYKLVFYLLENALKFSRDESMIMVGAYTLNNEYMIVVYNEGSGFDKEQLQYLGAMTQLDRDANEQQGVGMGIAIVLSLLKLYDGRINIITEKNKYTKVEVYVKS